MILFLTFSHSEFYYSSVKLDGELTSVKVSQDSQYALINHAPDVSPTSLAIRSFSVPDIIKFLYIGDPLVGSPSQSAGPQVHRSETRATYHPELLWWD